MGSGDWGWVVPNPPRLQRFIQYLSFTLLWSCHLGLSPGKFSGPVGSNIARCVTNWEINIFKPITNPNFSYLPNHILNNLSSYRCYAFQICWCVILGEVDKNIQYLEIGPLYHARWLKLGTLILHNYVSQINPSKQLTALAEFCVKVYFPSWFLNK